MDIDFIKHLPENFDPRSRVWIYQSSRRFLIQEALEMEDMFSSFLKAWNSHGAPVKGYANLLFGQFMVIIADETSCKVGGCSTDSSVRLIKEIENKYNVEMFNRQLLAFIVNDKIELIPLPQLSYAMENNFISANTLYFNNTVLTLQEMQEKWIIPVSQSWLAPKLNNLTQAW